MAARSRANRRLAKEFDSLKFEPPPGVKLLTEDVNSSSWQLQLDGTPDTLYEGERFILQLTFVGNYPFDSPEVLFVGQPPQHPHVYQNGHICLNILGDDWSPAVTVAGVCTSVLSMMSSCQLKEWPPDNDGYMARWLSTGGSPKKTRWVYHDDTV